MSKVILRKYGEAATFNFDLFEIDGIDFKVDAVHASGDTQLMKNEGAENPTDNGFIDEGQGYSIILTATEMEAARLRLYVVDQGTKAWLDTGLIVETYGHVSAQHPFFGEGVWDRVLTGATHNVPASSGRRLRAIGDVVSGAVDDASATVNSFVTDLTGIQVDHYADQTILFTSGNLAGMSRLILAYDEGTKELTIEEDLPEAPGNGDDFDINPVHIHPVSQIAFEIWEEILTSGTHNVAKSAGKRVRGIEEYQGYTGGFIYINTTGAGSAGSESYVNGTLDNPVDNLADANILGAALSITQYKVSTGSSLTFVSAQEYRDYFGLNWTLALGGQDINGLYVHGACISGISAALTVAPKFEHCEMNGATLPPCHMDWTALTGDIIAASAGDYFLYGCHSGVSGAGSMPSYDFNASVGTVNLNNRNYSGGFRVKNMGQSGTDTCSIEGEGQIVLDADCIATSSLAWRGHFNETDNSNGTIVTRDYISDRLDEALGATFDTNTDSLEAIRNRGDAAWVTGSGSIASVILAEKVETLLDINKSLNLSITATTRLQYQWLDIDGEPVNINGSTFKFKAVKNAGESSPAIAEITGTVVDAPNGRFYFDVLPTTVFKGRYEIWAVDGASNITPLTMAGGARIETHPRL